MSFKKMEVALKFSKMPPSRKIITYVIALDALQL